MTTGKLDLDFASINVTVNGVPANFEVEKAAFDSYWLVDGTEVHPAGCLNILIDVLPYHIGDVIIVEYDRGQLQCDGGGERRDNIVGEIEGVTVAMGAPATDEYEVGFDWKRKNCLKDMLNTKRALPYENRGFTSRGFEFRIVDDPSEYNDRPYRRCIEINIAWELSNKEYAWDIVSCLTS